MLVIPVLMIPVEVKGHLFKGHSIKHGHLMEENSIKILIINIILRHSGQTSTFGLPL